LKFKLIPDNSLIYMFFKKFLQEVIPNIKYIKAITDSVPKSSDENKYNTIT